MSTLALGNYKAVESNIFIKIECPYYKAAPGDSPTAYNFLFSDRIQSTTVGGSTYVGLGKLLGLSSSQSELRVSGNDVTITISGIPNSSVAEIMNSRIKGSKVTISRVLFDTATNQPISITGNPMTRYIGFVNNLALDEDYDTENRTSSNTLVLTCASVVDVLDKKISGRKTNPSSMKKFYPADISMDRVPTLENSFFDFGAK
jgi:hypothetical protein